MGNEVSGPELVETASTHSGRPRSPAPSLPTIEEDEEGSASNPIPLDDGYYDENNGDYGNSPRHPRQRHDKDAAGTADGLSKGSSIGFEVEEEDDDGQSTEANKTLLDEVAGTPHGMSLMEATAAVFHYLANAGMDDDASAYSEAASVSERSAAVFKFLEREARQGNQEAMISFLETASVVSAILQKDDVSISQASAAVFKMLENAQGEDMSISGRSAAVFRLLEDDSSVDSVSQRSAAVFQILDDARSVGGKSISEFSSAVFRMLDEAKNGDARSISERSAAIFRFLDDGKSVPDNSDKYQKMLEGQSKPKTVVSPMSNATTVQAGGARGLPEHLSPKSWATTVQAGGARGLPEHLSPKSAITNRVTIGRDPEAERASRIGEESTNNSSAGYSESANSDSQTHASARPSGKPSENQQGGNGFGKDDGNDIQTNKDRYATDKSRLPLQVSEPAWENRNQDFDDNDMIASEIDLEFVENFDAAFNEFIAQNPKFLVKNPDLVHNLRVTKLQKLLEFNDQYELDLLEELDRLKKEKAAMEMDYQARLRDASRKKAAREINLQTDLSKLQLSTKMMEAKLMWDLLTRSEARVKKNFNLRQSYKKSLTGDSPESLILIVPEDPDGQTLRDAILAPSSSGGKGQWSEQQEKDLRQFQVDNAFLNAEVTVLKKKLAYQKIAAKKQAWVESILLRLNEQTVKKLNARYKKKLGFSF